MTRHRWGGKCTRCLFGGIGNVCLESEERNPCEGGVCQKCNLHRKRDRFIHDPESDAKVRRNHRDVPTLYFVAGAWFAATHVPACEGQYPTPPVETIPGRASDMLDDLFADDMDNFDTAEIFDR